VATVEKALPRRSWTLTGWDASEARPEKASFVPTGTAPVGSKSSVTPWTST